jgi:hypothetical protein
MRAVAEARALAATFFMRLDEDLGVLAHLSAATLGFISRAFSIMRAKAGPGRSYIRQQGVSVGLSNDTSRACA